ncbi:release factor glutamine methyltransferase [Enteropsectra breve]|nr:release factor glutamine methyltransferase [Enteropsectra breve]
MDWYEPGEDTYTLLDVICAECLEDKVILDLGCSTGEISYSLCKNNVVISLDLNAKALAQMPRMNTIRSDLLSGIRQSAIDVCIFNPPYVPDFDCPILGGGHRGREVIDRFIATVSIRIVYLLIIEANEPREVIANFAARGYHVTIAKVRKVLGETIVILKGVRI